MIKTGTAISPRTKSCSCQSHYWYVHAPSETLVPVPDSQLHGLQFIFRSERGDAYLAAVSRFMTNAFEYGDSQSKDQAKRDEAGGNAPSGGAPADHSNLPYLNLPT